MSKAKPRRSVLTARMLIERSEPPSSKAGKPGSNGAGASTYNAGASANGAIPVADQAARTSADRVVDAASDKQVASAGLAESPVIVRRLNIPLLAATVVSVLLLSAAGYFWRSHQIGRMGDAFLNQAKEHADAGEFKEAASYFHRFLKIRPDDGEVRARLALAYEKTATEVGERMRAVDLYYEAIGVVPAAEQVELRRRLGRLLLELGRNAEAEAEAEKLLGANKGDLEGLRINAWALLARHQEGAADVSDEQVGQAFLDAQEAEVKAKVAEVDLALTLAEIYRRQPSMIPQTKESDRAALADQVVARAVKLNKNDPLALLGSLRYKVRFGLQGAEKDLREALKLEPDNPLVLLAAAEWEVGRAKELKAKSDLPEASPQAPANEIAPAADAAELHFAAAEKHYQRLAEISKSYPQSTRYQEAAYLGLGAALAIQERWNEAIEAWQHGMQASPSSALPIGSFLVDALIRQNRLREAREELAAYQEALDAFGVRATRDSQLRHDRMARYLQGALELAEGKPYAAIDDLKRALDDEAGVRDRELNDRLHELLARAYLSVGQWDGAASEYEKIAASRPSDPAPRHAAATAWSNSGRPARAAELFSETLQLLGAGRDDTAAKNAASDPEEAARRMAIAESYLSLMEASLQAELAVTATQRDWQPLLQILPKAREAATIANLPKPWRIDLLEANYWSSVAEAADSAASETQKAAALQTAEKLLRDARQKHPDDADLLEKLVAIFEQLGLPQLADETLDRFAALEKNVARVELAKAHLLSLRRQFAAAEQILVESLKAAAASDRERIQSALAETASAAGNLDAAGAYLAALDDPKKPNPALLLRKVELAFAKNDFKTAEKLEGALTAVEGSEGSLWRWCQGMRLASLAKSTSDKNLDTAEQHAQFLLRKRPEWPDASVLAGVVHEARGDNARAVEALERAVRLGERRAFVYQELFKLLCSLNRFNDAQAYAAQLKERGAFTAGLERLEVSLVARRGELATALALAESNVKRRPEDALAHLWLGQMLWSNGQHADAEKAFVRACELSPEEASVWNGLFSFHLRQGQTDKARQTLEQMGERAKLKPGDRAFVLAQGWQLLNDEEQAEAAYSEALRLAGNSSTVLLHAAAFRLRRGQIDEARKGLERAIALDPRAPEPRRLLAALLASLGGKDEFEKAIELLSGNDREISSFDRRLQALLYLQRKGTAEQKLSDLMAARRILEDAVQEVDAQASDHLLLARVYERIAAVMVRKRSVAEQTDLVKAARREYSSLAEKANPDPAHVALFTDFLLRRGEDAAALQSLDKLEQVIKLVDKPTKARLGEYIDLLLRVNRPEKVDQWLNKLVEIAPDDVLTLSLQVRLHQARDETAQIREKIEKFAAKQLDLTTTDEQREELYTRLGQLYFFVRDQAGAEPWYRKLFELRPERIDGLASSLAAQGRMKEALELCETESAKASPIRRWLALAGIVSLPTFPDAERDKYDAELTEALKTYPENSQLALAVASARITQGRIDDAVAIYEKTLEADFENVIALNNLATLLSEDEDRRTQALTYINRAIELAGPQPALNDTKGTILLLNGDTREAIKHLESAANSPNADPRFHFHLALAFQQINDLESAREQLNEARRLKLEEQVLTDADERSLRDLEAALAPGQLRPQGEK